MCDHEQNPATCEHENSSGPDPWQVFYSDPLFKKQNWDLDDWQSFYDKMPTSEGCEGMGLGVREYVDEIFDKEPTRVFFPLCGKTEDMKWAYDRGNTVVGLDAIEKPVRQFFEKHRDLQHSIEKLEYGKLYKSEDRRLQIFVCDVTKVATVALGKFDVVVDCSAYTAIHPKDRSKYVETVTSTLEKDYKYFLEVCHDAPPGATGQPHSISFREVKKAFGPSRKLKFLQTEDISEEWGVDTFFHTYLVMTPKADK